MDKRRKNLIERWGEEVTGDMPLDEYGFPLEQKQPDEEKKPASKAKKAKKSTKKPASKDDNKAEAEVFDFEEDDEDLF